MDKENKLILYKDDEGKENVNVRFADEDVWLKRENLAEIYATTPQNISLHVGNIYQDQELSEEGTRKKFFLVRQEGSRQVKREIDHYNLDIIIALGYRVQSPIAVRFRRWATQRLHEYIQKGFTMDDERLKQGGNRTISPPKAIEKAEHEFEIYREREMRMLESDFDKAVKRLRNKKDDAGGGKASESC